MFRFQRLILHLPPFPHPHSKAASVSEVYALKTWVCVCVGVCVLVWYGWPWFSMWNNSWWNVLTVKNITCICLLVVILLVFLQRDCFPAHSKSEVVFVCFVVIAKCQLITYGIILPIDFHIFKMVKTTSQHDDYIPGTPKSHRNCHRNGVNQGVGWFSWSHPTKNIDVVQDDAPQL